MRDSLDLEREPSVHVITYYSVSTRTAATAATIMFKTGQIKKKSIFDEILLTNPKRLALIVETLNVFFELTLKTSVFYRLLIKETGSIIVI